jgi:hypothetical protein
MAATSILAEYAVIDFSDVPDAPFCLNDQPLPVAQWIYPSIMGQGFPAGSVFTGSFSTLAASDRQWIVLACQGLVTFTFNDTKYSFVRGTATATLAGLVLRVTLTQLVKAGYVYGQGDFF